MEKEFFDQMPDYIHQIPYDQNLEHIVSPGEKKVLFSAPEKGFGSTTLDNKPKIALDYYNCTGLVLLGQDTETQDFLSCVTHHHPRHLTGLGSACTDELEDIINHYVSKTTPGSRKIVICGGNYFDEKDAQYKRYRDDYTESCYFLTQILEEKGLSPSFIIDPNCIGGATHVAVDTPTHTIYIQRPPQKNSVYSSGLSSSGIGEIIQTLESKIRSLVSKT